MCKLAPYHDFTLRVSALYEPSSGVFLIKSAFQMLDLLMTLVKLCTILEHKNTRS
jgi:hypothetical protein